jgi:hypothetical protein
MLPESLVSDLPVIAMLLDMSDMHGCQYERPLIFSVIMSFYLLNIHAISHVR